MAVRTRDKINSSSRSFRRAVLLSVMAHLVLFLVIEFAPVSPAEAPGRDAPFMVILDTQGTGAAERTGSEAESHPAESRVAPAAVQDQDFAPEPKLEPEEERTQEPVESNDPAGEVAQDAVLETAQETAQEPTREREGRTTQSFSETGSMSPDEAPLSDGPELESVLADLYRRMRDQLVYPMAARRRQMEGTVTVRVHIEADGTLGSREVSGSSGHSILDQAALDTLEKVFPVTHRTGRALLLTIRIEYSLT